MTRESSNTELETVSEDGQIPSVTQIIEAVGLGPSYNGVFPAILERKRLLGSALHAAIHYDADGTLDETSIHPEIAEPLVCWRQFLAESGFRVMHSEVELIHPQWRFKGHPDAVCVRPDGYHAILDLKYVSSLDKGAVALQLAGYRLLVTEVLKLPVASCAALQIHGGRYSYVDLTALAAAETPTFLAALTVVHARQRRR